MPELISIREAQERILAAAKIRPLETVVPESAYGRILAEDVYSPLNIPPFDNSSMDGFAVHRSDIIDASPVSPVRLPVKADIPAGSQKIISLEVGTAARILTGAPVPEGADCVVPVEETDQFKAIPSPALPIEVSIHAALKTGANIRRAGEDIQKSQQVLSAGRILQPQDIGVLISLGVRNINVMRQARIALFSSGDELLTPDQPMVAGSIYDANRYVLTGILEGAGAKVQQLGIVRDNPQCVLETLDACLSDPPDLILSSAGVSVGAFDYVQQVIRDNGSLSFWKVNMRPGKPITFGEYKGIPFLGLPGNPVSAYIGCIIFAIPFIRHLHGLPPFARKTIKAVLTEPLTSPDGRESFYRGVIRQENGTYKASLTGHQGSGNLFSLVQANALLIVPAGVRQIPAGETITAWALETGLEESFNCLQD